MPIDCQMKLNFPVAVLSDKPDLRSETSLDPSVFSDPRVKRIAGIVQEALAPPKGWKPGKWKIAVASKYRMDKATLYRHIKKFNDQGVTGLKHTKPATPRAWSPEALDYWIGLCLKRSHRRIAKDALYGALETEAIKQGWKIGGYSSAIKWYKKIATPQLEAMQKGGLRALDNSLPPVLRDYFDLEPFEIIVGDQHRFDFWVIDDETGVVFRPEGFFLQDLRTRCFYGGAIDKKYDSHLCGLAMRMGMQVWGAFKAFYSDNGKPELSHYISGILSEMEIIGLSVEATVDAHLETENLDSESVNPCVILPGTHKKAIVRNAKAKMIEGTFNVLEGILRDHFTVPGYCKRLTDSGEEQEVDEIEVKRLANSGKLMLFSEFYITVIKAMDFYNRQKPHRGVTGEWRSKPKPRKATPMDCLELCWKEGWRPQRVSPEAIDYIFLAKAKRRRTIDRGRIKFRNGQYEHEALIELTGKKVDVRFDPIDPEWLLVFDDSRFICRAVPVEYSSMKDSELASRKIAEKRRRRKAFLNQYRELTSKVPDIRNYGEKSVIEHRAALIRDAQRAESKAEIEQYRTKSADELNAEVERLEKLEIEYNSGKAVEKQLPTRPEYFLKDIDRFKWALRFEDAGGVLSDEDRAFKDSYEAALNADEREFWENLKQVGGL